MLPEPIGDVTIGLAEQIQQIAHMGLDEDRARISLNNLNKGIDAIDIFHGERSC